MSKNKLKDLSILAFLITAIGFVLLFFNVNLGISLADKWLVNQGGSADTSTYLTVLEGYKNTFLAAGSILFGIGVATIIFAYYKKLNINE